MGFPTLIFYLYLLAAPIGLILLGLWLMRYMSRLAYPPEKRILFIVILLACLTFILFTMGSSLNKWRSPDTPKIPAQNSPQPTATQQVTANQEKTLQQETRVPEQPASNTSTLTIGTGEEQITPAKPMGHEEQLELFEAEHYPSLYEQRIGLLDEIKEQEAFIQRLQQLSYHTPKQRAFLLDIYRIRKAGYDKLNQQNLAVSQYLRDFWVHYNTGNSHDAMRKFQPVATQLVKKIKVIRGQLLDSRRQEERVINKYLKVAGTALKNNKLPAHQAGKITTYSQNNRALVVDWLTRNEHSGTLYTLEQLRQQRIIIRDRFDQVKFFQKRYPDLKTRLNRTLNLWSKAQESNYYAEYRLLFAAESRYIVDYMGLNSGKVAAKRLNKELRDYTSSVARHADNALERAEQAYKPGQLR